MAICAPLYAGAISWTMVYDTIYAHMVFTVHPVISLPLLLCLVCHQDKKDDEKAGVMSSARGMAEYTKPVLAGFAGLTVAGIGCSGAAAGDRAFSDLRHLMGILQGSSGRFMPQLL